MMGARSLALAAALVQTKAAVQPNIVLMIVDELGTGDVPWSDPAIHAPTIQKLGAADGIRLGTMYAWHWCAPTRGSLLSGRFPMHTGYDGGGMPGDGQGFPMQVPLLGNELQRAGYKTHMLGKWHLGFRTKENLPINRGFDTFFGLLGGGADHYTKTEEACGGATTHGNVTTNETCKCMNFSSSTLPFRVDFWDGDGPAHELWDTTTYDAYQYAARAVQLVEEHDTSDPFFLYWAPHKVHSPLQAPQAFTDLYPLDVNGTCTSTPETCSGRGYGTGSGGCGCDLACYCNRRIIRAMVSVTDVMLANVTAALEAKHMMDNTVIVFLGDNGAPNQNAGSNGVFKGEKFGHWEGGHRVPSFIVSPHLPASLKGKWYNGTAHLVDLHATVLDLAGVPAAAHPTGVPAVDGVSLAGLLNGSLPVGSQVRSELWVSKHVLRAGGMKLISGEGTSSTQCMLGLGGRPVQTPHDPGNLSTYCGTSKCTGHETGADAMICGQCKCPSLNLSDANCHACLFDVANDPGETVNLASSQPNVVQQMHHRLRALLATSFAFPNPSSDQVAACSAMVNTYGGFYGPWAAPSPLPPPPAPPVPACSVAVPGYKCEPGSCAVDAGQPHGCMGLLPDASITCDSRDKADYFKCAAAAAAAKCKDQAGCTGFALSTVMMNTVKLYAKNASAVANKDWNYWRVETDEEQEQQTAV